MAHASLTPHQLAEIGALLAEPARAAMLLALVDGTSRPAGELAQAAGVGAPTASAHLKRLLEGGLLAVQVQGRHRYYRLAGDEVAGWLEALALPRRPVTLALPTSDANLRRARTCYRHLAGQLGVALCAGLLEQGYLATTSEGLALHSGAVAALVDAGLDPQATARLPDLRGRGCIDWTERRLHVGGPLGVALTTTMLEAGWLRPAPRGRALLPSGEGLRRLATLGVRLPG